MAKLLSFFGLNKHFAPNISGQKTDPLDALNLPPMTAPELIRFLELEHRILAIKRLASVNDRYWNSLYQTAINNAAETIQLIPASASHHHAGPGGLLTHTIEVCANAMRIAKAWQLPLGVGPEERAKLDQVWRYGLFAAALLHDMGKTLALVRITLNLKNGQTSPWSPYLGKIPSDTLSYRVDFQVADYQLYHQLSVSLMDLLPRSARHWLLQDMKLMKQLIAWLNNDPYECGEIGEIVRQADRDSTAADLKLGGHQKRFPGAFQLPMIDRLMTALRHLLQDGTLKINRNGAAAWIYQGRAYLVCRTVAQAVQQYLADQGATDIPTDPTRLYDTWQEYGYALDNTEGGAIWKAHIMGEDYDLKLTVMVFEATRLFKVGHLPSDLKGEIKILSQDSDIKTLSQTPLSDHHHENNDGSPTPQNTVTDTESESQQDPDPFDLSNNTSESPHTEEHSLPGALHTPDPVTQQHGTVSTIENKQSGAVSGSENSELAQPKVHQPLDSGAIISDPQSAPQPNDPQVAQFFIQWIKGSLADKSFRVNRADTPVHIVAQGVVLISPVIIKKFCQKMKYEQLTGSKPTWKVVQSQFHKLKLHIRTENHVNIHKFQINGNHKSSFMNGYLLPYKIFFDEGDIPPINERLTHIG